MSNVTNLKTKKSQYVSRGETYSYNCLCGKLCGIIERPLNLLPKRKKDGAIVVDGNLHKNKFSTKYSGIVYIRRENGIEQQFRDKCIQCELTIFYRHDRESRIYFILKGALIKSFVTAKSEIDYKVTTKTITDLGKNSAVTLSTIDGNLNEINENELDISYEQNAQIIQRHLKRKHVQN
ncbi:hypothetical protein A3Q56_00042 [Intoshia linei]|uniref:STING ER exit protein n=1 Tax=Intoshia linei TaxID=1819745 RepID=A0A177BEP3_9BILA|nr:hypothetical protein A3Q56_00042 [Intoshia linei]